MMAKGDTTAVEAVVEQPTVGADFPLGLGEFCARLSASDRRVELIGAFHFAEKRAGRVKDTEANYKARFSAFCRQPA